MRVLYYSVGLYLLKLSQEFLNEIYKKKDNIKAFYGGNITYKSNKLQVNKNNIYYRKFYQDFQSQVKTEIESENANKVFIELDIENYFNEISIPTLLHLLSRFVKPSIQADMKFDTFTREQIICLFEFISNKNSGIPQDENNIISGFIGYLYLVFGDLFIDDILSEYKKHFKSYKIIRYTDDIYISITFNDNISKKDQGVLIHRIASQIAEILYSELGLKLNLKTKLYKLSNNKDKEKLLRSIRQHPSKEYSPLQEEKDDQESHNTDPKAKTPQDKLEQIFNELKKIKKIKIENYFMKGNSTQKEILQTVFEKSVEQILDKPENLNKINLIFKNFNFDLVKVQPTEILIVLLKDNETKERFQHFCLNKDLITTGDADLIVKFLCQTGFNIDKENNNDNYELLLKLKSQTKLFMILEARTR
jgi:AbiA family abortive infection protein